mmetsp:Transcript_21493/g.48951  ORF Transcript_21493/g.48951 Transcript_21493/m.48951 type:complete len:160 (-) Transcript_21493:48-527(-)
MIPPFLSAIASGRLRVFGPGTNLISMVYVDNYCHAMILGYHSLQPGHKCLGKFYIATDGPPVNLWESLNDAAKQLGMPEFLQKTRVPTWLMMIVATLAEIASWITGIQFKLNRFAVKMMVIDRWFDITSVQEDLGYQPLKPFSEAWPETIEWFRKNRKP